jgi:hypothetical protein
MPASSGIVSGIVRQGGPSSPGGGAGVDNDHFVLTAGRNANVTNSYLTITGSVVSNNSGYVLPVDSTIVGIGVSTDGAESWTAEIRKNGSATVIASLVVSAAAKAISPTLDIDVDALDEIQFYCNGTLILRPTIILLLKGR